MAPRVESTPIFLVNGHTVKQALHLFKQVDLGYSVLNLSRRSFVLQWAVVNGEMHTCSKGWGWETESSGINGASISIKTTPAKVQGDTTEEEMGWTIAVKCCEMLFSEQYMAVVPMIPDLLRYLHKTYTGWSQPTSQHRWEDEVWRPMLCSGEVGSIWFLEKENSSVLRTWPLVGVPCVGICLVLKHI